MPQLQPISPWRSFLAGRNARQQYEAQRQRNAMMDLDLQRERGVNALLNDPAATPEAFARAGRADIGNAITNQRRFEQDTAARAEERKTKAAAHIGNLAQRILSIQDPAQRQAVAQRAFTSSFAVPALREIGIDPAQITIDDNSLQQWAMMFGPQRLETIGDLNNPARGVYQRDPITGELKQVTAPKQDITDAPSSVQEWLYFNRLSPEDRARYLEMKRSPGLTVRDVRGVPTVIQTAPGGFQAAPLSDLQEELDAEAKKKRAEALGSGRGKTQAEYEGTAPQRAEKVRQTVASIDNVFSQIDEAMKGINWGTAGLTGRALKLAPGTPAYDLAQMLLTIKANIGFDRLQAMRDASPTGGALGQVAIQELEALQGSIASLDQGQRPLQLKRNLEKVRNHYQRWKAAVIASQQQYPMIHPDGSPEADPLGIMGGVQDDPLGLLR